MSFLRIRRGGFTLIELLVVIAIITVLIAIGLPVMSRAREKARQTACIANLLQIQQSLRLYRLEEGAFPGPYDPVTGAGGLNSLYPTYVPSRKAFICPDDPTENGLLYADLSQFREVGYDAKTWWFYTLLGTADQMYDTKTDPITGELRHGFPWTIYYRSTGQPPIETDVSKAFFNENYSSYNLMYNWIGYAWWDKEDPNPKYKDYPLDRRLLLFPRTSTSNQTQEFERPIGWSDNLAFWYKWFYWDPEDEYGLGTNPDHGANRTFVNDWLQYYLAQEIYWKGYRDNESPLIYPSKSNDPAFREIRYPLQDTLRRDLWAQTLAGEDDPWRLGIPSGVFPGLINHNAPENTIITRCPWHRPFSKSADIALRLDGTVDIIPGPQYRDYNWAAQQKLTP
jgi:prepilin-type N-terminal cleavage/methylation domain-containing protein